jgi:replicative DNA helicase
MLFDKPSEAIVLSGLVKNPRMIFELDGKFLKHDDFYHGPFQNAYIVLRDLIINQQADKIDKHLVTIRANEIDVALAKDELDAIFARDVGKEALIRYAKKVKKLSVKRFLSMKLHSMSNEVEPYDGSVSELLGHIENEVFDAVNGLGSSQQVVELIAEGSWDYIVNLGKHPIGLDLGFKNWQEDIGEIRNKSVHGLFGRPKAGKSQLALQFGLRAACFKNIPTLILDSELGKQLEWVRLYGQLAQIPYKQIESGAWKNSEVMVEKMEKARDIIDKAPFYYVNVAGMPIDEIIPALRQFGMKYSNQEATTPQCLTIYDYVKLGDIGQLMTAKEYQILGAITSRLHDEANRLNMPVIMVGQLNRSAETSDGLDTIADSDKISRDIDSVSIIRQKAEKEKSQDIDAHCSHLLKVLACRSGPGHDDMEYINLEFQKGSGYITERERFTSDLLATLKNMNETVEIP